ncbi:hypothetical protein BOC40_35160 [Burkholderia pseudomallei]|nr:hypothetical protein BOC35_10205 [Burkholderia pseudomallei]ARK56670.1 hypothetical protein BOC36_27020 [Burkholderia pseudomallei]ARK61019.1 hypothetical protein BOC37_14810 [Burkholderia pseudomallei]ARK71535.1 hypothetical protein BOC38_34550 [Burkholderia pseudomallei]ARK74714.1 hypothetical protein BOC39_14735 [Burkholderia pseudomallei]
MTARRPVRPTRGAHAASVGGSVRALAVAAAGLRMHDRACRSLACRSCRSVVSRSWGDRGATDGLID